MSGNKIGGKKTAITNKAKYGEGFYKRIGALGGAAGKTGGFYQDRELASRAGRKGGRISRKRVVSIPSITVEPIRGLRSKILRRIFWK